MYPPARLNLYISHAPDDAPHLAKLLKWLRPLEQQGLWRIWYSRPVKAEGVPLPWKILLAPYWHEHQKSTPFDPRMFSEIEQAHIFLFLTSPQSLSTAWIDQFEITPAVRRYTLHGKNYVRIIPVPVSPSFWQTHSRLSGFAPLGDPELLLDPEAGDAGHMQFAQELETLAVEMQRNWTEREAIQMIPGESSSQVDLWDAKFPALADNDYAVPPFPPEARKPIPFPLPALAGWLIIFLIAFVTTDRFNGIGARLVRQPIRIYKAEPSHIKPEELRRDDIMPPPESSTVKTCDC